MKVNKPYELVGKEVFDSNGNAIGWIDKTWNSWNENYPGYFFGIKPNENARDSYFRGSSKLVPINSDYIQQISEHVSLNRTMDELGHFWSKTVRCGPTTCPTEELFEMSVYDKNYSRVGTFYACVESDGPSKHYGVLIDPYLCETWNLPHNKLLPIPTNYITYVKDAVTLNKTLHELREYWKQHYSSW